eukprot:TRINITY_DN3907_c0_g1_i2.p1 TRINITY_DN3907_c0_g1~~TRINITY_DN3907_c0_g1_i2.p1  ORF type:complete len:356 (-),score=78.50 TRINITY_DN3907_c0_g1_i2:94-1044(-)
MTDLQFVLKQVNDSPLPSSTQSSTPSLANNSNTTSDAAPSFVLPDNYASDPSCYSFTYKHPQSAMTFILKAIPMGDILLIHGRALEDKKVLSLEVAPHDYVNEKALAEKTPSFVDGLYKDVGTLISLFRINVTSKLLPSINKPGYEDGQEQSATTTSSTTTPSSNSTAPARAPAPDRRHDPLREPDRHPYRPHGQPPMAVGGPYGPPGYFGVGEADRFPGMPGLGGMGGMGGNLIGPNHPGFAPRFGDPYGMHDDRGLDFGLPGGQRLPPGAVPPGARFDPFGPPGTGPRPGGGAPFQRNYGDELPPPGFNDSMFF